MEEQTRRKIEQMVTEILQEADMEVMTEFKVRAAASERLGFDLSDVDHKNVVRGVVESFLLSMVDGVQEEPKEVARESQEGVKHKEMDGNGEHHICALSGKRSVVLQDFRGKTFVSIREYFVRDGKRLPSPKGINLTSEHWSALKKNVSAIEEAISKLQSKIRNKLGGEQNPAVVSDPTTQENAPNDIAHLDSTSHLHGEQRREKSNSLTSASQEFVPIEITRFSGKNYHSWAAKMEMFLKQLNLLYLLTDPCPVMSPGSSDLQNAQAEVFLQKRMHDDYLCRHNILNSLSDPLYHQFSKKAGNAKELWEELKFVYLYEFGTRRSQVRQYLEFQIEEGKPVLEQVQELNSIADFLSAAGMMVPENFHVSAIIFKLPPSWKDFCVKLMHDEHLPFWMLMDHIRVEEEARQDYRREDSRNSKSFHAASSLGPRASDMRKPFVPHYKREPADSLRKSLACDYCGKKGHLSNFCWHKKSGKEVAENSNGGNLNTSEVVADANIVESRSFS